MESDGWHLRAQILAHTFTYQYLNSDEEINSKTNFDPGTEGKMRRTLSG
jgi:hypothetical protein